MRIARGPIRCAISERSLMRRRIVLVDKPVASATWPIVRRAGSPVEACSLFAAARCGSSCHALTVEPIGGHWLTRCFGKILTDNVNAGGSKVFRVSGLTDSPSNLDADLRSHVRIFCEKLLAHNHFWWCGVVCRYPKGWPVILVTHA
jgi:hypothetical protein